MQGPVGETTISLPSLAVSRRYPARAIRVRHQDRELCLRPTTTMDAEAIAEAISVSLPELRRFMPWSHYPQSALSQLDRLRGTEADFLNQGDIVMAFFEKRPDGREEMLAMIGLHARVPLNPTALEVGYWAATPHSNKGLTTLGVKVMTIYAFDKLASQRVQVMCDEANVGSRRVIEKCGFALEGHMRNVTEVPTEALIQGGYAGTGRHPMFALVPETFAALEWPRELRRNVKYVNFAGYEVA